MRTKQILGSIIILCLCLNASAKDTGVYKAFLEKISNLEKNLAKEKNADKRLELYLKAQEEISTIRKKNPRQEESDEIAMGLFFDTLAELPPQKDFKKENCADYIKKSKSQMHSSSSENPYEEIVKRGWKILSSICRK